MSVSITTDRHLIGDVTSGGRCVVPTRLERDEPPPDSEALTTQSGGPNGHREVRNVSPKASCAEQIPLGYPWSTAAGASYMDNPKAPKGGRGLVLEHVRPRNILIGNMIERSE